MVLTFQYIATQHTCCVSTIHNGFIQFFFQCLRQITWKYDIVDAPVFRTNPFGICNYILQLFLLFPYFSITFQSIEVLVRFCQFLLVYLIVQCTTPFLTNVLSVLVLCRYVSNIDAIDSAYKNKNQLKYEKDDKANERGRKKDIKNR